MIFSSAYRHRCRRLHAADLRGDRAGLATSSTTTASSTPCKLARPKEKRVYRHNDVAELDARLSEAAAWGLQARGGGHRRHLLACAATMRRCRRSSRLARKHDAALPGERRASSSTTRMASGAFGATGRGTEEATGCRPGRRPHRHPRQGVRRQRRLRHRRRRPDRLPARDRRRSTSTPTRSPPPRRRPPRRRSRSSTGPEGLGLLATPAARMTAQFRDGLDRARLRDHSRAPHPVVPLFVRDTPKTTALVRHLLRPRRARHRPQLPRGAQRRREIRFQVSADHTAKDIDFVLDVLAGFGG